MIYSHKEWREFICGPEGGASLERLYKGDLSQRERYISALDRFAEKYGELDCACFSAPGRTELCGNHTDHQRGHVLAAAVSMDIVAFVSPNASNVMRLYTKEMEHTDMVDYSSLSPRADEKNDSAALVRGVAARFKELGYNIGGYDAYLTSDIPRGSGLSSSAAFEVLLGTILNHLYNEGKISPLEIAQIGQYAENVYFGKPCGLMDQAASSAGGIVHIDFENPERPLVEQIAPPSWGYEVCIINTGGSHADLTNEYADIPNEMRAVSNYFGRGVLREVDPAKFEAEMCNLRKVMPDRALLRAMHFFSENERVLKQVSAVKEQRWDEYIDAMIASGRSSFMLLQNVYPSGDITERGNALALAVSEKLLAGEGAWRIHGGGFAGTIQALVPHSRMERYQKTMAGLFGEDNFFRLTIRPAGGYMLEI